MLTVLHADSRNALREMSDASIDAVVTDPPYGLVFMGRKWDTGEVAFDPAFWVEVLRVMKPGAHLVAFGGTRTYHRLVCAIEDAGFEVRDQLAWVFGSGFPKSHDVAKAIDKAARQYEPGSDQAARWQGWGSALKPAFEPIVLARKPLIGTIAANVLAHGTGALNIDACRVGWAGEADAADAAAAAVGFANSRAKGTAKQSVSIGKESRDRVNRYHPDQLKGRWPANLCHDGSPEVLVGFPETGPATAYVRDVNGSIGYKGGASGLRNIVSGHDDFGGSAARFFYTAKADKSDRLESKHPTVKPVDLMAWLIKLITPPGGVVLDPFAGSGTTGMAAMREGFDAILVEREAEYVADIKRRIAHVSGEDGPLFAGDTARTENVPVGAGGFTGASRTKDRADGAEVVSK